MAASKILVVDDTDGIRRGLSLLLRAAGYDVTPAPGGAEALDKLAETRFDLVLLDLSMPDVDGLMVLEQIREWPHLTSMPVVVYSAVDDEETRRKAMRLGASAYLQKGNTAWDELARIVKRYVEQRPPTLGGGIGDSHGMGPASAAGMG